MRVDISLNYYSMLVAFATIGVVLLAWAVCAELDYVAPMCFGLAQ